MEDRHVVCDQPGLGRDFGHGFVSAEFGQRYQAGRRCDALDPGRGDRFGAQQEPCDAGQVTGIPGQAADCLLGAAYQVVEVGGQQQWAAKQQVWNVVSVGPGAPVAARQA